MWCRFGVCVEATMNISHPTWGHFSVPIMTFMLGAPDFPNIMCVGMCRGFAHAICERCRADSLEELLFWSFWAPGGRPWARPRRRGPALQGDFPPVGGGGRG